MTKRKRRKSKNDFKIELDSHVARDAGAVIYFGLSIIFLLIITGKAGVVGNWLNSYLRLLFGVGTFVLPLLFLVLSITLFFSRRIQLTTARYIGIVLLIFSALGLVHMGTEQELMLDDVQHYGGYIGFELRPTQAFHFRCWCQSGSDHLAFSWIDSHLQPVTRGHAPLAHSR